MVYQQSVAWELYPAQNKLVISSFEILKIGPKYFDIYIYISVVMEIYVVIYPL